MESSDHDFVPQYVVTPRVLPTVAADAGLADVSGECDLHCHFPVDWVLRV